MKRGSKGFSRTPLWRSGEGDQCSNVSTARTSTPCTYWRFKTKTKLTTLLGMQLLAVPIQVAREATTCLVVSRTGVSSSSLVTLPPSAVCTDQYRWENNCALLWRIVKIVAQAPLAKVGNANLKLKEAECGVCLEPLEEVGLFQLEWIKKKDVEMLEGGR